MQTPKVDQRNRVQRHLWLSTACLLVLGNVRAFALPDARVAKLIVLGPSMLIMFCMFPLLRSKLRLTRSTGEAK